MRISWLPREPGTIKLVVEPLNVLCTLKLIGVNEWKVDALGQEKVFKAENEGDAKMKAVVWFDSLLSMVKANLP